MPSQESTMKVDVNKLLASEYIIKVQLVGMTRFRIRVWAAKWMLKFVGLVTGCDVVFEPMKEAEKEH